MKQGFIISQYTCAVLLIVSSIALVAYQVVMIDDVSNGLLVYVAQAFLLGQAADIRPKDPAQFQRLVAFLKSHALTDQLLTGNGWLHISWAPFSSPRHYVRIGYYK